MERLREKDEIDGGGLDGDFFHVPETVFDVGDAVAQGLLAGDFEHFGRGVDGDHALGSLRE